MGSHGFSVGSQWVLRLCIFGFSGGSQAGTPPLSGNAQTMEKKEAVIINCSEMRTEGTSRSSAGMLSPACPHGSKRIESLQSCAGS